MAPTVSSPFAMPYAAGSIDSSHTDRANQAVSKLATAVENYAEAHGYHCPPGGVGTGSTGLVAHADCGDHPTFRALSHQPRDEDIAYGLRWQNHRGGGCQFTAQAFGDLDDDGVYATFETAEAIDENGVNRSGFFVDREDE